MGILDPIDLSLVGYTPGTPAFAQLVSDTLGNAGDVSDGFDQDMAALVALVPATDQMLLDLDPPMFDLLNAADGITQLSLDDLALDWILGAPALTAWSGAVMLKAVPPLVLPPSGTAPPVIPPVQPPVICLPIPPSPPPENPCPQGFVRNAAGDCVQDTTPAPPGPPHGPPVIPPHIPPPPIIPPAPSPCPQGFVRNTAGDCVPEVVPPTPPQPPVVPPIIPPAPSPCPQGYMRNAAGDCVPQTSPPTSDSPVNLGVVLGAIINQGVPSGSQTAALLSGSTATILGATSVIFSTIIPVIGAFSVFNSIFGSWQSSFSAWASSELAWAEANPLAAMIYQLEQQVQEWRADMLLVGSYEHAQLQKLIDRNEAVLTNLYSIDSISLTPEQQSAFIIWAQTIVK